MIGTAISLPAWRVRSLTGWRSNTPVRISSICPATAPMPKEEITANTWRRCCSHGRRGKSPIVRRQRSWRKPSTLFPRTSCDDCFFLLLLRMSGWPRSCVRRRRTGMPFPLPVGRNRSMRSPNTTVDGRALWIMKMRGITHRSWKTCSRKMPSCCGRWSRSKMPFL